MNWDAIGAIGEIVGGLGVIATLIYLAIQIRQNTRTMQGQTIGAVTQNTLAELLPQTGTEIAKIYMLALTNPSSLLPHENAILDTWMIASFSTRQNEFLQYRLGALHPDVWRSTHQAIRENLGHEWGRRWWDSVGSPRFMPEFVEFVESLDWRDLDNAGLVKFLKAE